jgi:hypothetical protein
LRRTASWSGVRASAARGRFRPGVDHGQQRPLLRVGHGPARRPGRRAGDAPERLRGKPGVALQGLGEPFERLRRDRPRISARPEERLVRGAARDGRETALARSRHRRRNAVERRGEVGARVAVRDRKDVDPVQVLAPRRDGARSGDERAREARAVEERDADTRHSENSMCFGEEKIFLEG